jgi:Gpi18-like mannosyltransferase
VFFISRIGLFLLAYLSLVFIPAIISPPQWQGHPDNLFLDGWSRWDSGWYMAIAEFGYQNTPSEFGQDTAFFPIYPLLVRLLNVITDDFHVAGILVSNISFLLALAVLFQLLSRRYGAEIAERALVLIAFSPFSFFFSAAYTESVFLLATACSFHLCERKRYLWAALWAAVASGTRPVGLITVVGLVLIYLEQIGYDWRRIRANILVFSLGLMGTVLFMLFLAVEHGNALQFWEGQRAWGTLNPWDAIARTTGSLSFDAIANGSYEALNLIHVLSGLFALCVLVLAHRRVGLPYTIFALMIIAASCTRLLAMGRYLIIVFPLFVGLAFLLTNRTVYLLFLYMSITLLALFCIMFSHWYWVA